MGKGQSGAFPRDGPQKLAILPSALSKKLLLNDNRGDAFTNHANLQETFRNRDLIEESMSALDVPLNELGAILGKVDETSIDRACALLVKAHKTAVCGCGREALQMKGLATRMFHLGLPVSVVGD